MLKTICCSALPTVLPKIRSTAAPCQATLRTKDASRELGREARSHTRLSTDWQRQAASGKGLLRHSGRGALQEGFRLTWPMRGIEAGSQQSS